MQPFQPSVSDILAAVRHDFPGLTDAALRIDAPDRMYFTACKGGKMVCIAIYKSLTVWTVAGVFSAIKAGLANLQ